MVVNRSAHHHGIPSHLPAGNCEPSANGGVIDGAVDEDSFDRRCRLARHGKPGSRQPYLHSHSLRILWECEAENARLSNEDAERQFDLRPDLFSSLGEARSFMTRAFSCEFDPEDGLTDHRREVIDSEWFERRR